ncbi:MAG: hypothetical protein AAGF97_14860 [Planctomycetota bacterium]
MSTANAKKAGCFIPHVEWTDRYAPSYGAERLTATRAGRRQRNDFLGAI